MTNSDLGKIIKQRRAIMSLKLKDLSASSGVSASHIGRIERGERSPSAHTLRKIAQPLGFGENELFALAGFLPPQPSSGTESKAQGQLDPYVAAVLSPEPVEVQRAVVTILSVMKSMTKGTELGFAEFVRRKYPGVEEDIITMVKDILEHPPKG